MNKNTYFFDTYALLEIVFGNPAYEKYSDAEGITTVFNLAEFNYNLKKIKSKEETDSLTKKFSRFLVKVETEDVIRAMDLKTKKRNMSIPDSIGYVLAKKHDVKFLTGDSDFRKFDNVEFVSR